MIVRVVETIFNFEKSFFSFLFFQNYSLAPLISFFFHSGSITGLFVSSIDNILHGTELQGRVFQCVCVKPKKLTPPKNNSINHGIYGLRFCMD